MTLFIRRIIQLALGIAAALAAWPLLESLIHLQARFPGYLLYTAASGAIFGLVFGAFLGSADGIIASRSRRTVTGSIFGGIVGAVGGAAGFLVAQGVLFLTGEYLVGNVIDVRNFAMPIARAVGWAIMGACVGAASGIRSASGRKVGIGALGGFLGGILGGAAVEYGRLLYPAAGIAHLIGLLLLGVLIGLAYGFVERRLSFGVLRVLNGPFKSREFIINQRRMTVGTLPRCDIPLPGAKDAGNEPRSGYRSVADVHFRLTVSGRDLFIHPVDGDVRVNDQGVRRTAHRPAEPSPEANAPGEDRRSQSRGTPLKFDDVIGCGSARFLYRRE